MQENAKVLAWFRERAATSLLAFSVIASACGGTLPPKAPVAPSAARTNEVREGLELSLDQLAIRERILSHVTNLTKIGERNFVKDWELAEASDYVAAEWEKLGLKVERVGFDHEGRACTNLSVAFEGTEAKDEAIVLLAPYDSQLGSRGEAAAFSMAVLLELSRSLAESRHGRTVRLWALATSEALPENAPSSGARVAGERPLATTLLDVPGRLLSEKSVLVVKLENLGLADRSPNGDSLVHLVARGDEESAKFFEEGLEGAGLFVERARFGTPGEKGAVPPGGDLGPFVERGIPVLRVAGSRAEGTINADFAAIIASRLPFALGRVARNAATNDGMLTPEHGKDR